MTPLLFAEEARLCAIDKPPTSLVTTMEKIRARLSVSTDIGGIARRSEILISKSNTTMSGAFPAPWFICTLWLADWDIARMPSSSRRSSPTFPLTAGSRSQGIRGKPTEARAYAERRVTAFAVTRRNLDRSTLTH